MLSNFCKRPEQKYLFTGTESMDPVLSYDKKIQFDMRHCLQADAILSFGCDYRKLILEQTYKLNPIYEQKIIEKSSGLSMKEFVHCVISIFFYQQDSPLILKFSSPKKKLLFWNNFSSSKELTFEFLDLLNALSTLDDQFTMSPSWFLMFRYKINLYCLRFILVSDFSILADVCLFPERSM